MKGKKGLKLSSFQIISFGFLGVILIGAFLLMLPISSKSGEWTSFMDTLFTSASAVCVTGLVVHDTATYWTIFGQIVILILIQIGGMGVITLVALFFIISGKKIGLFARGTVQDAVSSHSIGGIIKYVGFILKGIFFVEVLGALIMMPIFISDYGAKGIWMSIFHSISAFCNAGFDIMGEEAGEYSSLTSYAFNPIINLTICALVIIGGIGFIVWNDVVEFKFRIRRYRLQSKVVLLTTAVLLVFPMIYFFFFEFDDMKMSQRILASLFQTVTPRTAGFNTIDLNVITEAGLVIMMLLMLIGGSPGSTAGGMKTTTIAVVFTTVVSLFKKKEETEILKRRVNNETVKSAVSLLIMYFTIFFIGGIIISRIENISMITSLFEMASAVGTVGLTLGITPSLHTVSKIILIATMYFGRVGGLTLLYATLGAKKKPISKYPSENITVG